MHHQTLAFLSSLLTLSLATPLDLTIRNADHSDGKCSNGQKPPCSDAPLCFYDYAPFVGNFVCQGGTPNWQYCDAAIDIVCSTLAYNISTSDSDPYESNIGTGQLEGQGADCFAQAANGAGATANLPYDACIQGFAGIKGCENNHQWKSFNADCVGGTNNLIVNGLAAGKKVDKARPVFVLGTTGAFFSSDPPQAGPAPQLKAGTSEDAGPSDRPNEGKPLATSTKGTGGSDAGGKGTSSKGAGVSAGRGVYLGD